MYEFDHVVHAVKKPELALEYLQNEGLHAVIGGKHEMWGTYNTLSYFGLSYIECIGIFDEALFNRAAAKTYSLHASIARQHFGLARFAIRTTTIHEDAEKFREAGLKVVGPTNYSRKREDGSVVSWRLLYVGHPTAKCDFPFFIQWDQDDESRRVELQQQNVIAKHPAGDLQLSALHIGVPNFAAVEQMATLCDVAIEKISNIEDNIDTMTVFLPNIKLVYQCPNGDGYTWDDMQHSSYGIQKLVLTGAKIARIIEFDGAIYEMTTR